MKRVIGVVLLVLALLVVTVTPVFAAPNENASCVAFCATEMSGQCMANCAQTMDRGISECAQMKHAECC